MARKKTSTVLDPPPCDCDRDGRDHLTSTVDTLAQEVRVLREAIDELRELLEWTMQNHDAAASDHPFRRFGGFPGDAVAKEEGEEINRPKPDDQPDEVEEPSTTAPGELF